MQNERQEVYVAMYTEPPNGVMECFHVRDRVQNERRLPDDGNSLTIEVMFV